MDVSGLEHGTSDKVPLARKGRSLGGSDQWLARVLAQGLGQMPSLLCRHGSERIRRPAVFTPDLNGVNAHCR